ncbi:MAG: hypothetical protein ACPL8I_01230 [Chloroflexaceae bacterium]
MLQKRRKIRQQGIVRGRGSIRAIEQRRQASNGQQIRYRARHQPLSGGNAPLSALPVLEAGLFKQERTHLHQMVDRENERGNQQHHDEGHNYLTLQRGAGQQLHRPIPH